MAAADVMGHGAACGEGGHAYREKTRPTDLGAILCAHGDRRIRRTAHLLRAACDQGMGELPKTPSTRSSEKAD
jgi:hypothetical protein